MVPQQKLLAKTENICKNYSVGKELVKEATTGVVLKEELLV